MEPTAYRSHQVLKMARAFGSQKVSVQLLTSAGREGGGGSRRDGQHPQALLPTAGTLSSTTNGQKLRCLMPTAGGQAPSPQPQARTGLWGRTQLTVLEGGYLPRPHGSDRVGTATRGPPGAGCAPQGDVPVRQDCSCGLQGVQRC